MQIKRSKAEVISSGKELTKCGKKGGTERRKEGIYIKFKRV